MTISISEYYKVMREIKFRVWDKVNKRFWYIPDYYLTIGFTEDGRWMLYHLVDTENYEVIGVDGEGLIFQQHLLEKLRKGRTFRGGES